jgi:membrane protein DedA with SNARE-associated domain
MHVEGCPGTSPRDGLDVRDGQVRTRQDDEIARPGGGGALGEEVGVGHRTEDSRLDSGSCPRAAGRGSRPDPACQETPGPVIAFIDQIALPFLQSLYAAVGYIGVMLAMAIESAMIPLPSELILPFAGFMVSDPTQIEPLTGQPWNFWIVVVVATVGNTLGSLVAYAIGAWGGRPFLERYGKYMLIREHEIEAADRFFEKYGSATVFVGRLLPIVRTFISFPAGVTRMPIGKFIVYSTAGAFPWSVLLVWAGMQLGANWVTIRDMLKPFDMAIAAAVVALFLGLLWWRLGMPGKPKKAVAPITGTAGDNEPGA